MRLIGVAKHSIPLRCGDGGRSSPGGCTPGALLLMAGWLCGEKKSPFSWLSNGSWTSTPGPCPGCTRVSTLENEVSGWREGIRVLAKQGSWLGYRWLLESASILVSGSWLALLPAGATWLVWAPALSPVKWRWSDLHIYVPEVELGPHDTRRMRGFTE